MKPCINNAFICKYGSIVTWKEVDSEIILHLSVKSFQVVLQKQQRINLGVLMCRFSEKKKLSFKLNFAFMKVRLNFTWLIRLGTEEYSFRVVLRQSNITTDPIYLFLILIMHTVHTKTWNKNRFFHFRLCNYIDYMPIYQNELIFLLKIQKHKSIRVQR